MVLIQLYIHCLKKCLKTNTKIGVRTIKYGPHTLQILNLIIRFFFSFVSFVAVDLLGQETNS